jgi:formylglycine-generating enzyme required for sulfatase activity/tRNA A-37 threonylcarbamoyl transferase component Bud32
MAIASVANFVKVLQESQLLDAGQLDELTRDLQARFPDPRALAKELVRRGWLTTYQAMQLWKGHGQELVLGPYLLLDSLGEGGMGQVFKARHRLMDRIVALKVIRQERLGDADAVRRFLREIRAAAQLSHPNIVIAHDAAQVGQTHLLVMEFIEGTDLAKVVAERGPLPVVEACDYVRQAALGLQHAHERGLVHRDIKPSNLLVTPRAGDAGTKVGLVKILDMGLARLDRAPSHAASVGGLTQEGAVMGTPDYLAPEQALDAHAVDIRGDIYSLGCTLYFLLTGQPPFAGGTLAQKLIWHQMDEPPPVTNLRTDLPPGLPTVLKKLLAKRPEDRYQTPAEVAAALTPFARTDDPTLAQPAPKRKPPPSDALSATSAPLGDVTTGPKRSPTKDLTIKQPTAAKDQSRRWLLVGGIGVLVAGVVGALLLAVGIWVLVGSKKSKEPAKETAAEERITNSIGMKLVRIPAGSFRMGSTAAEDERTEDEGPAHTVRITQPFYMGIYEVRQREYLAVMGKNPSRFTADAGGGLDHPVENVSWEDAMEFCRKLSDQEEEKRAGRVYRLPTEAEWEYACRAGTQTAVHYGDSLSSRQANFDGNSPYGGAAKGPYVEKTTKVGSYEPNAFGLYDMHGNVSEWCLDYYSSTYYDDSPETDPQCKQRSDGRVLRGGSWINLGRYCRAAFRSWHAPSLRSSYVGFRVVSVVER